MSDPDPSITDPSITDHSITDRRNTESRFTAAEEEAAYRPVSLWAIVAFLAGLASPVALVHPLGLFVPAAGISLAAWAFHTIDYADPRPTGRRWAVAGLILSLFFAAAAPVRFVARRNSLHQRACAFCDQWLAAIRENRPWLAFELTRPAAARPDLDTPLAELDKSEGFRAGYQKFLEQPAVKLLLADRDGFRARFLREVVFEYDPVRNGFFLHEDFEATFSPGREPQRAWLRFGLERTLSDRDGREQWRIDQFAQIQAEDRE